MTPSSHSYTTDKHNFREAWLETILQACHIFLDEATKEKWKLKCGQKHLCCPVGGSEHEKARLKCTLEEADVKCGLRLPEIYRPGHMEVDGGIQLVSTGPQRAHSSKQGREWGVACPLPHKWTTQQNSPKGKSCVAQRWMWGRRVSESICHLCTKMWLLRMCAWDPLTRLDYHTLP